MISTHCADCGFCFWSLCGTAPILHAARSSVPPPTTHCGCIAAVARRARQPWFVESVRASARCTRAG
eukprot:4337606-Prymnesium_polylepis.1